MSEILLSTLWTAICALGKFFIRTAAALNSDFLDKGE
jgi:hypothetical protein